MTFENAEADRASIGIGILEPECVRPLAAGGGDLRQRLRSRRSP
jgi:hypothetical protein